MAFESMIKYPILKTEDGIDSIGSTCLPDIFVGLGGIKLKDTIKQGFIMDRSNTQSSSNCSAD